MAMVEGIIIAVIVFMIIKFIAIRSQLPKETKEDKEFVKKYYSMSDEEIDHEFSDRPEMAERVKMGKKLHNALHK